MKNIRIGQHVISWKLVVVLFIFGFGSTGVTAYYVWQTLTIPLEVKEPLEILHYPSQLELYPGENLTFNITVLNHASVNYSVALNFSLSDFSYQANYVTFSNKIYVVNPGQQDITAWLAVLPDAPPTNISLIVNLARVFEPPPVVESLYMSKLHVWFNTTSPSWAESAFKLVNTRTVGVLIDKITCRSQTSDWSNVYYWKTNTVSVTDDLTVTHTQLAGATYSHIIQNAPRNLTRAEDDINLQPGWTIIFYIKNPDSIGQNDVGILAEVVVFTTNAYWTQEANVEAAH